MTTPTTAHIPWRRVMTAWPFPDGSAVLILECGHLGRWPFGGIPFADQCPTCDPPIFHGKPLIWADWAGIGSTQADDEARKYGY